MEYHLTEIRFETLEIDPDADTETPSGAIRQLDLDDLAKVFKGAARQANGALSRGGQPRRGEYPGRLPVLRDPGRTIPTTSSRTSIGASSVR